MKNKAPNKQRNTVRLIALIVIIAMVIGGVALLIVNAAGAEPGIPARCEMMNREILFF